MTVAILPCFCALATRFRYICCSLVILMLVGFVFTFASFLY